MLTALASEKVKKTELNGPLPVAAFLLSATGIAIARYAQGRRTGSPSSQHTSALIYWGNDAIAQLLQAAFSCPPEPITVSLMNRFLILHAEHGLNCSTLAVRTAASNGAAPFAAIVAGLCAFKGPLHGRASREVGMQHDQLLRESQDVSRYIDDCLTHGRRLPGIGHRLYKQPDPRAAYMQRLLQNARADFASVSPHIDLCDAIVHHVNHRPYFTQRGLHPNPDLFNGILLRRIGFPPEMNTLLLCLSRTVGWLAHYYDSVSSKAPLIRPQELYADEEK
ncbi:MAG: citrate/2-methylcitrate synthase [Symbiopectobacterium sp.]|uniref:citrate/2-methylcitrate synthase n=1 Tax=Symbiopectobacterium sp. TaxID=2952789 RepID=UPI0039E7A6E8